MTSTSSSDSEVVPSAYARLTAGDLILEATKTLRSSGSASARLDAELLLGHVLRTDRAHLLATSEVPVGADHAAVFRQLVDRRATGEPVAYIRGLKEFYGIVLAVDSRALIPRPETELLVDIGIDLLRRLLTEQARPVGAPPVLIWDLATGSGAVCIALAVEARRRGYAPDIHFRATDVSTDALGLATENAVGHAVADMIEFGMADLADLAGLPDANPADLLLANLPYIPTAVVPTLPIAASFEPRLALDGGEDGLELIRRVISELEGVLTERGVALLEIGSDQADGVRLAVAGLLPGWEVTIHPDLAGLPRVAEITRVRA